jgi:hypothetical protein
LRILATCRVFLVFLVVSTVLVGFNVRPAFSQSSVVLPGNVLPFLSQAQTLASPNAQFESQTRLALAIGLAMRDRAGLDAYIEELQDRNSSNYHQWLTPVEIANEFGPSQGDYDAVVAWLQGQGIKVTQTFNHRLVIMASATADVASRVFGVSFGRYNYNNQTFVAASNEPSVPAQFSGIVSSITGLDTYYGLTSNHAHRGTPVGQAGPNSLSPPYTPANIRTAYNLPVLSASGVKMGVLSACEASTTDLNGFASTYSLPSYTLNTNYFRVAVNSKGDGSDPPTDQEPTLDVEWSHALGPGATLYFYFDNFVSGCGSGASWAFSGSIAAAAKALADNLVQTWSTSWGCSEDHCYSSAARGMQDTEYANMVAAGMTGFVATGDNGAYANLDKSTLDVQFPGSDPNVVAVGGTTLTINNDGSYGSESALWCPTCITDGWGGGGGNSVTFIKPSWQSGVTGVSGTGRGLPDASLDMDFHYPIYYGGTISTLWGGTSFAAPEWNGIMATVIYATTQPSSRFGNINYLLYSATSTSLWTKRDVTTGANGYTSGCGGNGQPQCGYSAGSGWDYATGWGSLDGILVELTTNVASGSGSVSPNCPSGCSEEVGSAISVSATPSSGYTFSSWTISSTSCSGGSSSNPCTFTMPSNAVTVSATFTQITQTLVTGVDAGSGSVSPNCPSPSGCSETVDSSVTVTATASSGWQFSGWSTQTGISCSNNPCTFGMPNNAVTLEATFTQLFTVMFYSTPSGFVGVSSPGSTTACGGTFTNGQVGTCSSFSANANPPSPSTGWQFDHWSWTGGVSCLSSSANPATCFASGVGSLTTVYAAQITFATNPGSTASIDWGSCSGPGYGSGQSIFSTSYGSMPACYVPSGYTLSSWSCSGGLACSGSNNPTLVSFSGPGIITLNLKTGSLANSVSTSLTASASPANPVHGTSFTVSGALTANGGGLGGEQIVLVFGWSSNIVTVTTQSNGSYSYITTAPTTVGPYNVDAFFLGDLGGSTQYLPSTATAAITVT